MAPAQLPLRDVHLPPAPGWWPPAPGWWMLIAAAALLLLGLALAGWRRRRRRRGWREMFERETAAAGSDAALLAAMSSLLRRASRRVDPAADRLQGEAWLRFLDGRRRRDFSEGPGRLLLEGGFQRQPEPRRLQEARAVARRRFLELMAARR